MATVLKEVPVSGAVVGSLGWLRNQIAAGAAEKSIHPMKITPRIAEQLLLLNTKNRNFKPVKIEQFRRSMRAGFWRGLNGETIKIKADGSLGDGQNRLAAVRDEGVEIDAYVMFGASDDDIRTVDQGAARTAGDIIRMEGVESAVEKAAIARLLIAYEGSNGTSIGKANRISNSEIILRVTNDNRVHDAASYAIAHRAPGLPGSAVGFLWYVFASIHRDDAEVFLGQVCRGINLKLNSPGAAVREYLINRVRSRHQARDKKIEAMMRGWCAFRDGRNLTKAVTNGSLPELV
jgi:hypothetical protein